MMDIIAINLATDETGYIKNGAKIYLGAYKFRFLEGKLYIEEIEVYAGLVLKPFPVQIFKMAMENPNESWSVIYPDGEK